MSTTTAYAPGRVELLGNHTDYNEGFILSAAIDRGITLTGETLADGRIVLETRALGQTHEADLARLAPQGEWVDYPLGVVETFRQAGYPVGGFRAVIENTLPLGAGLSSSAALEVGTATLLRKLFGFDIEPLEMARLCRRAENTFVGMNCGLMDQASSVFGEAGHVIFLDCRSEQVQTLPLPEGVGLLITPCGVAHQLTGGEYNERRAQCFDAAERLGKPALRDVAPAELEAARERLPELSYRRARHIVGENDRVHRGVAALRAGDAAALGALMWESHESSRTNFENSTPELDALVEAARGIPGVYGSRLTGGGFGGATITLVAHARAAEAAQALAARYQQATGVSVEPVICQAADGAR